MNILVTGATGFIGRHLVEELVRRNEHAVFCLVRNPAQARHLLQKGIVLLPGDITDKPSLQKVLRHPIDILYHCAAAVDERNPALLHRINSLGTENVCELGFALSIRRMVYLSSVAVVSGHEVVPLTENLPYLATNAYGASKVEAEKKVLHYRNRGLPVVILRPPIVYGEDEPHLMRLMLFLLKYHLLPLLGGGGCKMHLVYVKNVVAAMLFCLEKKEFLEGSFFVADREVLTVREALTAMCEGLRVRPPFSLPAWFVPMVLALPFIGRKLRFFAKDRVYSTERIRALGFCPPYSAYESLVDSSRRLYYGNSRL